MRRVLVVLVVFAATLALVPGSASSASAYGGGASHDMWQIGISFNCNNPTACADFGGTGGFWGWGEFDRQGDQTWGDAQLRGRRNFKDGEPDRCRIVQYRPRTPRRSR